MMMLIIHFFATIFMTGVIWIVQVVTYPQLRNVSSVDFIAYEKAHMRRIGMVVGPMMILEVVTGLYLWTMELIPSGLLVPFSWSLVLGVVIALSTAFIQAPIHGQLAVDGKDEVKINKLIQSNWIRTICWTGRALLLAYIFYSITLEDLPML